MGWVKSRAERKGVLRSRIVQHFEHVQTSGDADDEDAPPTYKMPGCTSQGFVFRSLMVIVVSLFLICCPTLISSELIYDIESKAGSSVPIVQGTIVNTTKNFMVHEARASQVASSVPSVDKLLRIKLVCHPRWLLARSSLAEFL